MKLIDLLVQELPKCGGWPRDAAFVAQSSDGKVFSFDEIGGVGLQVIFPTLLEVAHDRGTSMISAIDYRLALAAIKPLWDGEGLPPVGAEFEHSFHADSFSTWHWRRCTAVGKHGVLCVDEKDTELYLNDTNNRFRPIRSEADKNINNNALVKLVDGCDIDHWASLAKERFHKLNELESELIEVRKMLTSFYRSLKEGMMHHKIVTDEE